MCSHFGAAWTLLITLALLEPAHCHRGHRRPRSLNESNHDFLDQFTCDYTSATIGVQPWKCFKAREGLASMTELMRQLRAKLVLMTRDCLQKSDPGSMQCEEEGLSMSCNVYTKNPGISTPRIRAALLQTLESWGLRCPHWSGEVSPKELLQTALFLEMDNGFQFVPIHEFRALKWPWRVKAGMYAHTEKRLPNKPVEGGFVIAQVCNWTLVQPVIWASFCREHEAVQPGSMQAHRECQHFSEAFVQSLVLETDPKLESRCPGLKAQKATAFHSGQNYTILSERYVKFYDFVQRGCFMSAGDEVAWPEVHRQRMAIRWGESAQMVTWESAVDIAIHLTTVADATIFQDLFVDRWKVQPPPVIDDVQQQCAKRSSEMEALTRIMRRLNTFSKYSGPSLRSLTDHQQYMWLGQLFPNAKEMFRLLVPVSGDVDKMRSGLASQGCESLSFWAKLVRDDPTVYGSANALIYLLPAQSLTTDLDGELVDLSDPGRRGAFSRNVRNLGQLMEYHTAFVACFCDAARVSAAKTSEVDFDIMWFRIQQELKHKQFLPDSCPDGLPIQSAAIKVRDETPAQLPHRSMSIQQSTGTFSCDYTGIGIQDAWSLAQKLWKVESSVPAPTRWECLPWQDMKNNASQRIQLMLTWQFRGLLRDRTNDCLQRGTDKAIMECPGSLKLDSDMDCNLRSSNPGRLSIKIMAELSRTMISLGCTMAVDPAALLEQVFDMNIYTDFSFVPEDYWHSLDWDPTLKQALFTKVNRTVGETVKSGYMLRSVCRWTIMTPVIWQSFCHHLNISDSDIMCIIMNQGVSEMFLASKDEPPRFLCPMGGDETGWTDLTRASAWFYDSLQRRNGSCLLSSKTEGTVNWNFVFLGLMNVARFQTEAYLSPAAVYDVVLRDQMKVQRQFESGETECLEKVSGMEQLTMIAHLLQYALRSLRQKPLGMLKHADLFLKARSTMTTDLAVFLMKSAKYFARFRAGVFPRSCSALVHSSQRVKAQRALILQVFNHVYANNRNVMKLLSKVTNCGADCYDDESEDSSHNTLALSTDNTVDPAVYGGMVELAGKVRAMDEFQRYYTGFVECFCEEYDDSLLHSDGFSGLWYRLRIVLLDSKLLTCPPKPRSTEFQKSSSDRNKTCRGEESAASFHSAWAGPLFMLISFTAYCNVP